MSHEPGPLVSAEWVANNLERFSEREPEYRLVEVDSRPGLYDEAHIPGAVALDWRGELQDSKTFDVVSRERLGRLLGERGITPETTIVLYGDFYNWFAAHAYWLLRYYRHGSLCLLDGGRAYWRKQSFPMTDKKPDHPATTYEVPAPDESMRADRDAVGAAIDGPERLVDVRAPPEYRGEVLAPPGWNEGVQRGGHIPGAENVPCRCATRGDRRFKSRARLENVYEEYLEDAVILYCRVGERAALTWFVLHELLGHEDVRYYYGSWIEWGNTVGLPVAQPSQADLRDR